jgi:hypothetical protein
MRALRHQFGGKQISIAFQLLALLVLDPVDFDVVVEHLVHVGHHGRTLKSKNTLLSIFSFFLKSYHPIPLWDSISRPVAPISSVADKSCVCPFPGRTSVRHEKDNVRTKDIDGFASSGVKTLSKNRGCLLQQKIHTAGQKVASKLEKKVFRQNGLSTKNTY